MKTNDPNTVVGVFSDHAQAQRAIHELKRRGFTESQIGLIAPHAAKGVTDKDDDSYAAEGATAGLATGAGVGALWGLAVLAGALPAIGPAIAGGTLAAMLSSAAAGAATAGIAGGLIGLGINKEDASYYENEFRAGRSIVTVHGGGREAEARQVMESMGAYDVTNRGRANTTADSRVDTTHTYGSAGDAQASTWRSSHVSQTNPSTTGRR